MMMNTHNMAKVLTELDRTEIISETKIVDLQKALRDLTEIAFEMCTNDQFRAITNKKILS